MDGLLIIKYFHEILNMLIWQLLYSTVMRPQLADHRYRFLQLRPKEHEAINH